MKQQIDAKADTAKVTAIEKKVFNPNLLANIGNANMLDSLNQVKQQMDSLRTNLTQVKIANTTQDSVIARTGAKTDSLAKEYQKCQKDIEMLWSLQSDLFTNPELKKKFDAATPEEKAKMIRKAKEDIAKQLGLNK